MLRLSIFFLTVMLHSELVLADKTWAPYPESLRSFDYSPQNLDQHWQMLTGGFRGPLPTALSLQSDAERWPALYDYTRRHLQESSAAHPELSYLLEGPLDGHFEAYARELRTAWSLLFNGRFKDARDLGLALGPAGYFPALYAQALHATLIEPDPEQRRALLEEVISRTQEIRDLPPDHPIIRFGNAYGKARTIEEMSATEALGTGYTSDVLETLESLLEQDAENIYAMTLLAGVQAGIIEKAGSFVARITYGASESKMKAHFEKARELAPEYPGLYYEYARAIIKVRGQDGEEAARDLLKKTSDMTPESAEEALLVQASARLHQQLAD